MCCESYDQNYYEHLIIEEIFENIKLFRAEFSAVNLVEELEEHKYVEEDRVMFSSVYVPDTDFDWWGNIKYFGT